MAPLITATGRSEHGRAVTCGSVVVADRPTMRRYLIPMPRRNGGISDILGPRDAEIFGMSRSKRRSGPRSRSTSLIHRVFRARAPALDTRLGLIRSRKRRGYDDSWHRGAWRATTVSTFRELAVQLQDDSECRPGTRMRVGLSSKIRRAAMAFGDALARSGIGPAQAGPCSAIAGLVCVALRFGVGTAYLAATSAQPRSDSMFHSRRSRRALRSHRILG